MSSRVIQADKNCETEDWYKLSNGSFTEHESENWFSCQKPSYWFTRTMFLSLGELFLEDMHSFLAIIVAAVTFLFINIMLINLLIATMSSTVRWQKVSKTPLPPIFHFFPSSLRC